MEVKKDYAFYGGFTIVTSIPETPVAVKVKEGATLYIHGISDTAKILSSDGKSILSVKLEKSLSKEGKEADVYEINAKCVIQGQEVPLLAKVYKKTSERVKAKTQLLCKSGIYYNGIAFPVAWLSDSSKDEDETKCFGILMPKIQNSEDLTSYINNIKIPAEERLKIVRQLLNHFMFLHKNNIQLVDFNLKNFLINKETKEVSLIDTDSFQIENFPCNVASPDLIFDHPKRIKEGFYNYSMELREPFDMVYGLCVLLFKIMMIDDPYKTNRTFPRNSNDTDPENILRGKFSFINDEGPRKYSTSLWKNCPEKLKKFFKSVFDTTGRYFYDNGFNLTFEILWNELCDAATMK